MPYRLTLKELEEVAQDDKAAHLVLLNGLAEVERSLIQHQASVSEPLAKTVRQVCLSVQSLVRALWIIGTGVGILVAFRILDILPVIPALHNR